MTGAGKGQGAMHTYRRPAETSVSTDRRLLPAIVTLILALVLPALCSLPGTSVQEVGAEVVPTEKPWLSCYATGVLSHSQGLNSLGQSVSADRSDPTRALGAPERTGTDEPITFFSLGFGGHIVLEFAAFRNGPGADILVVNASRDSPCCEEHPEKVRVEASQDGAHWFPAEPAVGCLDSEFDLGPLEWAKYLRLTDASDPSDPAFVAVNDGYDLDGVAVRCPEPFVVCGVTWEDLDADGVRDEGEPRLGGVRTELLRADPHAEPVLVTTAITSAETGAYSFTVEEVPPATSSLMVRERVPDGWRATTPTEVWLTAGPGEEAEIDFGNERLVPGLAIDKTGPTGLAQMGDTLTYTLTITNTGNVPLTNVVLDDELLSVASSLTVLEPGASAMITASLDVDEAVLPPDLPVGAKRFTISNTATATSDQVGPVSDTWDVEVEFDFHAPRAALGLEKTGPTSARIGDTLTYTLRVANVGDVPLTNVRVVDAAIGVDETVPTLAPGASRTFTGIYVVSEADLPGPLVNTATATSDQSLPVEADWQVVLQTSPGLVVVKTGPEAVRLGDTVEYTVSVRNVGDVTLRNIRVRDALLGLDGVIPSLVPGSSQSFAGAYGPVSEADLPGPLVNRVTASAEGVPTVEDSWSTAIETAPGLSIDKTGPVGPVRVGDTITYTITLANAGDVALTQIRVVDAKLGLDAAIGSLAAGGSREFRVDYTVRDEDVGGDGVVRNTAVASSPLTGEVEASWSVPVARVATASPTPDATVTPEPTATPAPVEAPEPSIRSDVIVIIYGGWDGIPVRAWVGGTEQPSRETALNDEGEAQAMWSFYPPEGVRWTVRVAAELPAGLDPVRWEIQPLDATTVTIGRREKRVIRMQLVDRATPTPVPQPPALPTSGNIDPAVAARVAGWLSVAGLAGAIARHRVRRRL